MVGFKKVNADKGLKVAQTALAAEDCGAIGTKGRAKTRRMKGET